MSNQMHRLKIKKVTTHFGLEKMSFFNRYFKLNEKTVIKKEAEDYEVLKAVRCCSSWKHSEINLASFRRELFIKILCKEILYF